jgi:hypothetical protein
MSGPVNGNVPEEIIQQTRKLAPDHWSDDDFIIGRICVTYDHAHQAWTDHPEVGFTFDIAEQIKTMLEWADHMIKNDRKATRTLLKLWNQTSSDEERNRSCAQGGEISEYLFDKYDDFFL